MCGCVFVVNTYGLIVIKESNNNLLQTTAILNSGVNQVHLLNTIFSLININVYIHDSSAKPLHTLNAISAFTSYFSFINETLYIYVHT